MRSPEHQKRAVHQYLEAEGLDDVEHLEKVSTETVMGGRHDVWDVHTRENGRWWVVTEPTNLYSQTDFKSMDVALSFHLGLSQRIFSRPEARAEGPGRERLRPAWRRWTQAAKALEQAEEAEDFQAVGMRCRQCLLAFVRDVGRPAMVPKGTPAPKRGDVVHWTALIAGAIAAGRSNAYLRSYLKSVAKETWDYVNWLTHATGAARFHADIAIDMTANVLSIFNAALVRSEAGSPKRCPSCSSYRIVEDLREEDDGYHTFTLCESCGWERAGSVIDVPEPDDAPPQPPQQGPHTLSSDVVGAPTLDEALSRLRTRDSVSRSHA